MNRREEAKDTFMKSMLARFHKSTRGANMVEYILLVGVVALIAIAGFKLFGGKVKDKIQEQGNSVGGINGQAQ